VEEANVFNRKCFVVLCALLGASGCFDSLADHMGAYDGTIVTTISVDGGPVETIQGSTTIYVLEGERDARVFFPTTECVVDGSYKDKKISFSGDRCVGGEAVRTDIRLNGDADLSDGDLKMNYTFSGTQSASGRLFMITGTTNFRGRRL
jgi:type 1 fimbria pilin